MIEEETGAPAEGAPQPEPVQAPVVQAPSPAASPDRPPGYVPQRALDEERRERQALQERLTRFEQTLGGFTQRFKREEEPPPPDLFKDPDGYTKWIQGSLTSEFERKLARIEQDRMEERIETSRERWSERLGDKAEAFFQWAESMPPQVQDQLAMQRDPFGAAYKHYKQVTVAQTLGDDDLESFLAKKEQEWIAKHGQPTAPAPQPQVTQQTSLTSALQRPQAPTSGPASFASSRDAQPRTPQGQFAPRTLGEILNRNS